MREWGPLAVTFPVQGQVEEFRMTLSDLGAPRHVCSVPQREEGSSHVLPAEAHQLGRVGTCVLRKDLPLLPPKDVDSLLSGFVNIEGKRK